MLVGRELQHPLVELEPGDLAVEEAVRRQRSGIGVVRVAKADEAPVGPAHDRAPRRGGCRDDEFAGRREINLAGQR